MSQDPKDEPTNLNLPRVQLAIGEHGLSAHVARTEEERAMGLMFVRDLGEDEGMLFLCDEVAVQRFWMKDTPLPLSIAFLEEDGTIVRIRDLEPHSLEGEHSGKPVRYVLEANQGWFEERGIRKGMRVEGPPFVIAASSPS